MTFLLTIALALIIIPSNLCYAFPTQLTLYLGVTEFYDSNNVRYTLTYGGSSGDPSILTVSPSSSGFVFDTFTVRQGATYTEGKIEITILQVYIGFYIVVSISTKATFPPPDTTLPTYSNVSSNSTTVSTPCLLSVLWADNVAISGFIVGNNNTGTFKNQTWTSVSNNWGNYTIPALNATPSTIQWEEWANDTSNNWNNIGLQTITTVQAIPEFSVMSVMLVLTILTILIIIIARRH